MKENIRIFDSGLKSIYIDRFPIKYRENIRKLNKKLEKKDTTILTIEDTNSTSEHLGFAIIYKHSNSIYRKKITHGYHLDYLAINKIADGLGLGKMILEHIKKRYKNITLECVDGLIPYYAKNGFNKLKINKVLIANDTKWNIMYYGESPSYCFQNMYENYDKNSVLSYFFYLKSSNWIAIYTPTDDFSLIYMRSNLLKHILFISSIYIRQYLTKLNQIKPNQIS